MTIPPQSGAGIFLRQGESLEIIDVEGEQVCDLFCYSLLNPAEALSSGRSIDYNDTIYLTRGHKLYSNSGQVMLTIEEDTCGRHDFLVTPCSQQMFDMISGNSSYHPSCLENLEKSFAELGIAGSPVTTTFNIFMNVPVATDGRIQVLPPKSKAGDRVVLLAHMDLAVGLTACSDEATNNGCCKPIQFRRFIQSPGAKLD